MFITGSGTEHLHSVLKTNSVLCVVAITTELVTILC